MCKSGKEIKLCTCFPATMNKIVHHKKSRKSRNKARNEFTWTLHKCLGWSKETMDGMGYLPDETLSEDLTNEIMLIQLNSRDCFDFDYQPQEDDNLNVYTPENGNRKHLSFIFKNGEWTADWHLPFKYEMKKINYGKVSFEDKTEKE